MKRGLARLSARHPWTMLGAWVIGLVVLVGSAFALGPNLTSRVEFTNDQESQIAFDSLERVRGKEPLFEQIVVQHETLTVDDAEFAAFARRVFDDVVALNPEHIEFVTSFYAGPSAGDRDLVSEDGRTTLVQAKLVGDIEDAAEKIIACKANLRIRRAKSARTKSPCPTFMLLKPRWPSLGRSTPTAPANRPAR